MPKFKILAAIAALGFAASLAGTASAQQTCWNHIGKNVAGATYACPPTPTVGIYNPRPYYQHSPLPIYGPDEVENNADRLPPGNWELKYTDHPYCAAVGGPTGCLDMRMARRIYWNRDTNGFYPIY